MAPLELHVFVQAVLESNNIDKYIQARKKKYSLAPLQKIVDEIRMTYDDTAQELKYLKHDYQSALKDARIENTPERASSDLETELQKLDVELRNARRDISGYNAAAEMGNRMLQEDIDSRLDRLTRYLGSIDAATRFIHMAIGKIETSDTPLSELLVYAAMEHPEVYKKLASKLPEHSDKVLRLQRSIAKLIEKNSQATKQNNARIAELETLIEENEGMQRNLRNMRSDIEIRRSSVSDAQSRARILRHRVEALESSRIETLNGLAQQASTALNATNHELIKLTNRHFAKHSSVSLPML